MKYIKALTDWSVRFLGAALWRRRVAILFFACSLGNGCADPNHNVTTPSPAPIKVKAYWGLDDDGKTGDVEIQPTVRVLSLERSYSGLELMNIAIRYAAQEKIVFDWSHASCTVWIRPNAPDILAEICWCLDIGKPFLSIMIDRYGRAIRHERGVLVD